MAMTDFVAHSARDYRATAKPAGGILRRGNVRSDRSPDRRPALLECDDASFGPFGGVDYELKEGRFGPGTLDGRIPIVPAIRPFRDAPDERRIRPARKAAVCPGCGIVPPKSAKCAQCWDV